MIGEDGWKENEMIITDEQKEMTPPGPPLEIQRLNARRDTAVAIMAVGGLFWFMPLLIFLYQLGEAYLSYGLWRWL